jgi:hypothetical protein
MHPLKINEHFSFDDHVDLDGLLALHDPLCKAIASCNWAVGANAIGREDGKVDVRDYELVHESKPDPELQGLDFDARNKFYLLKHNAGQLGWTVRVVKSNFYGRKHLAAHSEPSVNYSKFVPLLNWLDRQALFVERGRVVVFISAAGQLQPAHHDYSVLNKGHVDEFLWLRTSKTKSFGLYDNQTPRRFAPIESYTAWFNNDQYHGGPPEPAQEWSFSIRVDGVFTHKAWGLIKERPGAEVRRSLAEAASSRYQRR